MQSTSARESALHTQEKKDLARYNQRLLDSTGEGIYGIDVKGHCTFMNRAGSLILGGRPEAFLGKDMHALVHHHRADGSTFDAKDCPIYKASRSGEACRVDDEVFWRLDGTAVPVEYSSFPIKDEAGHSVEGAVITFNDITARVKAQDEIRLARDMAEAANESKSQFLANMSHELRTPLNAVIMYSELLAEEAEERSVADLVPDLEKIRSAGKHLLELVNSVLDLSKIEAGKMELFPEDVNVPNLVHEVAATIAPLTEKKSNSLTVNIASDVDTMFIDVTKLRQVLYNLLSNACKFTENGTIQLTVARHPEDDSIQFKVADSGIGMSAEQLSRLFQPFSQADASTTRKYGGTGLGLAIIKRFTDLMHGDVAVTSVEGQGTQFVVTLPERTELLLPASTDDAASESSLNSGAPTSVPKHAPVVLVIDDDPTIRDVLMRVLVAEGMRPVTAADGEEGLRRATELHPDLIILDVLMPKVDGWSVLAAIKADDRLADIPVIMQSIRDDRDLGFMLGASEYLVKPIDRKRLVTLLNRHVNSGGLRVLVVEDDQATQRAIARTLKRQGWQVTLANNGIAAIDELRKELHSVILLDLMMPKMDGFEFLEQFRLVAEWQSIPVIVLTAKDLTAEDRARLNGEVERILAKGGLNRDQFLTEVRRLVGTVTGRPESNDVDMAQIKAVKRDVAIASESNNGSKDATYLDS